MQSAGAAGGQVMTVRVLVVDDYGLFRGGLARLLDAQPEIEVVGEAEDGRAAIRLAAELEPDVVLLDLELPDLPAREVIEGILAEQPDTSVVALVSLADEAHLDSAAAAGACGFLPKESPIPEVVGALRAAADAGAWLSPTTAENLLEQLEQTSEPDEPVLSPLSGRQQEVLRLIARGMEGLEIDESLNTSPGTADDEVAEIVTRLPLARRVEALG